ncbi:DUF1707 domain-containing protein [Streptomyces glaucescens]|nr:DUF1707 domain-containing protein [Streptomyces glaucescens]
MDEQRDPAMPAVRVSDRDRDRALGVLAEALAEGRIDAQEQAHRTAGVLAARTAGELAALTADLPAPVPGRAERNRRDLEQWLAEWRYWLGGAVVMSAAWGVRCVHKGELTYYWPIAPLGIWAAVLIAVAIWPRGEEDRP